MEKKKKTKNHNTAPWPPAQGNGSHLTYPPLHRPPSTSQPGKEALTSPSTELELRTHFPQKQQKNQSTGDQLTCRLKALLQHYLKGG